MIWTWYRRWRRPKWFRRSRWQSPAPGRFLCRPHLETLEDRRTPATHTWTGAVSQYWSNPGNWSGGTPFGDPSADLVFNSHVPNPNTVDDVPGVVTVHNISFSGQLGSCVLRQSAGGSLAWLPGTITTDGATGTIFMDIELRTSGAVVGHHLDAGGPHLEPLILNGRITGPPLASIIKEGSEQVLVDPPVGVADDYLGPTYINAGAIVVGHGQPGSQDVFSRGTVTVASGAYLWVSSPTQIGALAGGGTVLVSVLSHSSLTTGLDNASTIFSGVIQRDVSLTKVGTGTLTLSGHNTYTGTTTIAGGTLQLGVSNALASSAQVYLSAGGTRLDLNGFDNTISSLVGVAGSSVTLGSATLTLNSGTFSGVISGAGGKVTKNGSGIADFAGNNSYGGLTSVNAGTLLVDGSQPVSTVTVAYGATLSGYGTTGFLSVLGTIRPTDGRILHSSTAVFNGGSTFDVTLRGTTPGVNYGQLNSSSTINIGGNPTLHVSLDFNSAVGDQFVIMAAAGGLSGTFTGLSEGQVFAIGQSRFQIHYTGNSVVLTHVSNAATHFLIGAPTTSQAGAAFDVTVTAVDAGGHPDPLYTGTVHFSSQDPYGALLPPDYTFTAADQGQRTFPAGATLFTAGTWDVTATDTASGISGTVNVQVTPAPASVLVLTAPAGATSGSPFDVTVTAQDPYGNTDTNYQGTATFSTSDPDPGVVLPADYTFQPGDQGSVTFAGGATLITPGDQTVAVSDTGSDISGNATVTVSSGPMPREDGRRESVAVSWAMASTELPSVPPPPPVRARAALDRAPEPSVALMDASPLGMAFPSRTSARRAPTTDLFAQAIDLVFDDSGGAC